MLRVRGLRTSRIGDAAVTEADLVEWNYGEYEGLTTTQIREVVAGWVVFRDGCPAGETAEQVAARVDRVSVQSRAVDGDAVLFAHGHVLRVLAARWIGLSALGGQHFVLRTGAVSVLGFYREIPAVRVLE